MMLNGSIADQPVAATNKEGLKPILGFLLARSIDGYRKI